MAIEKKELKNQIISFLNQERDNLDIKSCTINGTEIFVFLNDNEKDADKKSQDISSKIIYFLYEKYKNKEIANIPVLNINIAGDKIIKIDF